MRRGHPAKMSSGRSAVRRYPAVMRFQDEFEAYVGGPADITVDIKGAAFVRKPIPVSAAAPSAGGQEVGADA